MLSHQLFALRGHVPSRADEQPVRAEPVETRKGVGVELIRRPCRGRPLDAEDLPGLRVRLSARGQSAQHAHEREARDAGGIGGAFPHAGLVDQRLPHVEHDGLQSHEETSARSSGVVTFRRRGSPSTQRTRPPAASTRPAQSLASPPPATARRSTSARKACGVWTATSSLRSRVSTTSSPSTRLTVSATGSAGTAPSQPLPSAPRTRSITSAARSGRAASWTRTTAASSGTSATPARTESARVLPPVTAARTFPAPSSSERRMAGSSHPSEATMTIASIHSQRSRRSRLSASSGRPDRAANAFGRSPPSRSPRPAATRTAQTPLTSEDYELPVPLDEQLGADRVVRRGKVLSHLAPQGILGVLAGGHLERERDGDVLHRHGVDGRAAVLLLDLPAEARNDDPRRVVAVLHGPAAELLPARGLAEEPILVVRLPREVGEREAVDLAQRPPPPLDVGRGHEREVAFPIDRVHDGQIRREPGLGRFLLQGPEREPRLQQRHDRAPRLAERELADSRLQAALRLPDDGSDDLLAPLRLAPVLLELLPGSEGDPIEPVLDAHAEALALRGCLQLLASELGGDDLRERALVEEGVVGSLPAVTAAGGEDGRQAG